MMKKEMMAMTAQLEEFDEALYGVGRSMAKPDRLIDNRSLARVVTRSTLLLPRSSLSRPCSLARTSSPSLCL